MDELEIYPRQAAAVALKAMEQGVAKTVSTKSALIENATRIIRRAQEQTKLLMKEGIIKSAA